LCICDRLVTPEAGHALEILGRAIERLKDECVHEASQLAHDPQVEAIQLLMAFNRQIYFTCPVVPTFAVRLHVTPAGTYFADFGARSAR